MLSLLIHIGVVWLVCALISRVTADRTMGIVAGSLFVLYPGTADAVSWIASVNELLTVWFYLGALWAWLIYLETGRGRWAWVSLPAGVVALLTKESAATLPVALFSAELIFYGLHRRRSVSHWVAWGSWAAVWLGYVLIQGKVTAHNLYAGANYTWGGHIVSNFFKYIAYLAWPFAAPEAVTLTGGLLVLAAVAGAVVLATRHGLHWPLWLLILLCTAIVPVLPFTWAVRGRYLYLAAMAWAGLLAGLLVRLLRLLCSGRARATVGAVLGLAALAVALPDIRHRIDSLAAITDVRRDFLADVAAWQPKCAHGDRLTFLDPPLRQGGLQAAIHLLYRDGSLVVQDQSGFPMSDGLLFYASGGGWRKATLVAGEMTLIVPIGCCEPILASSETHRTFDLKPPRYAGGLEVVGYAMDRPALWPGSTALLQLDWRATSAPTADYTVFTHFVDSMWRIWGQKDQPLRNRQRPTGQWSPGEVASDYYLIPIGPDVPPGRLYFITVGIYAWPSVQAEKVINQGESMPAGADRLLLGPFEVARAAKESAKDAEHK